MPVRFGEFTIDESRRQLLRANQPLRLSPKAFQLLSILVENGPKAVSKADLQERLWPDTFVTEGNLATLVAEVRSALGEDAKEPRFIRTLYGFGYSFEGSPVAEEAPPVVSPQPQPRRWIWWAVAAVAITAILVVALSQRRDVSPIRTLAVLPFDVSGADRADAHLAIGLPDLLITRLTNVRELVVRPTSSIRKFAKQDVDPFAAGKQLEVDAVVDGSIRTTSDAVRVTVQLLDMRTRKPVWAERFDLERARMFAMEDDISARVTDALTVQLTPAEKTLLAKRFTKDADAYQQYVLGRYWLAQTLSGPFDAPMKAASFFERAVQKDPAYALGWADLARSYAIAAAVNRAPPRENWLKAEKAAQRALELDANLAEAHAAAGSVRMYWYLDYAGAEREFRRSLELNPRYKDVLIGYGYLLQCQGRFDESEVLRKRYMDFDPKDPTAHWGLANNYLTARRYDDALKEIRLTLALAPNHRQATIGLIRVYCATGRVADAIALARQLVARDPNPESETYLGYALAMSGQKREAAEILRDLEKRAAHEHISSFFRAVLQISLGNHDAAFALLEKALQDREWALRVKTEPILDPIRSDPRYRVLLQRAGFDTTS